MAKDRFSRQKRSNYDSSFKWGTYISPVSTGRKPLTEEACVFLKGMLTTSKAKWESDFIRSVLKSGKMPTARQKEVILKIIGNE